MSILIKNGRVIDPDTRKDGRYDILIEEDKIVKVDQEIKEEAEEVIQYIDDWEPSDEEDDLDEEELWEPVIRHMSRYPVLTLGVSFGVKDKEKEGRTKRWILRLEQ